MKLDFRQRLLATTLLVGASVVASPAFAQDAQPDTATPTGPVEGQPTPDVAANGAEVESTKDIVVTGTRIPSANLESVAPVTTVTSQDIKLQGTAKVEDLLNSLPSVVASQASTLSNGSDGTATVDLRGLGAKRTLVLVNGRRLTPGDVTSAGPADINIIPSAIVKRVEVLTGGASSTYGADAVAGVVNFIMDSDFEGIRFDGQYSVYQHNNRNRKLIGQQTMYDILNARKNAGLDGYGYPTKSVVDGGTFDGTVALGTGFDDGRGHATAYFGYRKVNPVLQSRRDYSACTIQNTAANFKDFNLGRRRLTPSAGVQCGGSATSGTGNAFIYDFTSTTTFTSSATITTFTQVPYNIQTGRGGLSRYNFAPTNYFQRPDERYTAGVFANYEISPAIKPYLEFMFMDDRTVAQIAPSGDFGNTLQINCDNPLLSTAQKNRICNANNLVSGYLGTFPLVVGNTGDPAQNFIDPTTGAAYNRAFFQLLRRNVEGGPRRADLQHTTFRGVLGSKGDLGKSWSYDAYYQYGRVNYQQTYFNEFSVARLTRALDVVDNPNIANTVSSPFQAVCRSVLDGSDPNCVPYDVFSGAPVSAAAINYLTATGFQRGNTSEQIAHVDMTGLLGDYGFKSPWAEDGVAINVGAEWRKESLHLATDNAFQTGDLTGQGAPTLPIDGSFDVKEFFGEISIPIVQKSFIYDLSFTAGYRHSSYSTSANDSYKTDTYKLGLEFAPIRDVRLRGAYNRAARAPNVQELFATQFVGLDGSSDPCAGRTITATDYGCIATGLNPGTSTPTNPAGQYNGLLGGEPTLVPEVATTKTLGVVLQPRFLDRFALSVDWFDIKVKKAIQGFGADAILTDCINNATQTFTPVSCDLVQRDPGGSLWLTSQGYVIDLPQNIGGVRTRGFEFNGSYSQRLGGVGTLSASLVGTLLKKYEVDNGLTPKYDCAGYYGATCGTPLPKWRHKARLSLNMPSGITLSGQWRYVGKVAVDLSNPSATLAGDYYDFTSKIKAQSYFDLAASANIGDHYNFRLGVNNIMDRMPPMVTSGSGAFGASACPTGPCNGNTYPATYDALGRYLYAGITLDF